MLGIPSVLQDASPILPRTSAAAFAGLLERREGRDQGRGKSVLRFGRQTAWKTFAKTWPKSWLRLTAGSFQNYERAHLNALAATCAPKFPHLLPPELVRRVAEYAFHVGDY